MTDAPRSGLFITFEGVEGAGKSTQIKALADALGKAGVEPLVVREPGSTEVGEEIRRLLLAGGHLAPEAEVLLFLAARAQLVRDVLRPALAAGRTVICDRYVDSTIAYQGHGLGLDLGWLEQLNQWATGRLMPQLTVVLDLDPDSGAVRAERRNGHARQERDRIESRPPDFHQRARAGYHEIARREPERVKLVDASRPVAEVAECVWQLVASLAARSGKGDPR